MSSRNLFFFFLILPLSFSHSLLPPDDDTGLDAINTAASFDFSSFSLRNLTLLGDSYIRNGLIGLTRELGVPSSSSGSFLFNRPFSFFDPYSNSTASFSTKFSFSFFDPYSNSTASFSTKFSFSISNVNPSSFGDGFAFFLSPNNLTLGSPGGFLGLLNSSQSPPHHFIAIEFDTRQDAQFNDPDDNHVGLDIHSLTSLVTANPILLGKEIDLKSGNLITAWIDYKNLSRKLRVFLSYSNFKPQIPVLSVDIDLSGYLKEPLYVGFSASTEGSTELHWIENWSFQTYGMPPRTPRPVSHPHSPSTDDSVRPPIAVSDSGNRRHKRLGLGLGIAGPAMCFVLLAVFGYISLKKWRGMKMDKTLKAEFLAGPKEFSYKELKAATKGFHSSRIVGQGAFGTVYKAYFTARGSVSAVKRSKHSHEGKSEFLAELSIIAGLRHKNLVQLQGWCIEKGELLLVYEFMPNGSLDKVLYLELQNGTPLKWNHRYNIALGLASVLAYLHEECEQQVIHRDIKASNIMLDVNYNARLGDFGLARITDHDKSPVSTLTAGTMGYLAPEYLQYGKATEKTDVFSFGVVILEVACGRRPIEKATEGQKMENLVDWVWGLYSEGRILEAADKRLNGEFREEDMKKLLVVGLSCANPDSRERPSTRRVLQILKGEASPVMVPKMKPTLTFSCSLPLRLEDIVSEDEDCNSRGSAFEIRVE